MDGRLLSIDDIALQYNVSSSTVRRWIRSGKLVGQKAGVQWRFDPSAVREAFERGILSGKTRPLSNSAYIGKVHDVPEWARSILSMWRRFLEEQLEQVKPDHVIANDRRGARIWALTMPDKYVWGKNLWHSTAIYLMEPKEVRKIFARQTILLFDELLQHGRELHELRTLVEEAGAAKIVSAVCVRRRSHAESGELLEYEAMACEDVDDKLFAKRGTFVSQLVHLFEPPLDVDHLVVKARLMPSLSADEFLDKLANWGLPFVVWLPDREHKFMAITLDRPQFFDCENVSNMNGFSLSWESPCKIRFYVDFSSGECFCSFIVYPVMEGSLSEWAQASDEERRDRHKSGILELDSTLGFDIDDAFYRHAYCRTSLSLAVKLLEDFVESGAADEAGVLLDNSPGAVDQGLLRGTFGPSTGDEVAKRTREILSRAQRGKGLFPHAAQNPPPLLVRKDHEVGKESYDSFGCRKKMLETIPLKYPRDDSKGRRLQTISYAELLAELPQYAESTIGRVLDYELDRGTVKPLIQPEVLSFDGDQKVRLCRAFCRGEFGAWFEWDRTMLTHHDIAIQRTLGVGPTVVEKYLARTGDSRLGARHFDKLFTNLQHDWRENVHDLLYLGWRPYKYGPVPVVPDVSPSGDFMQFERFLIDMGCLTEKREKRGSQIRRGYEPADELKVPWRRLYKDRTSGVTRAHISGLMRLYAAIQQDCKTVRPADPCSSGFSMLQDPLVVLATARNQVVTYRCGWYEVHDWRQQGEKRLFPLLNAIADTESPTSEPFLRSRLEEFAAPGRLLYDKIEMYRNLPLLRQQIVSLLSQGDFDAGEVLLETIDEELSIESNSVHPILNLEGASRVMRAFSSMTRQILTACKLDVDDRPEHEKVDSSGVIKDSSFYLEELLASCPETRVLEDNLRDCIEASRGGLLTAQIAVCLSKTFDLILSVFDSEQQIPDPREPFERAREYLQTRDGLLVRVKAIAVSQPYAVCVADVRNLKNLPKFAEILGVTYDQALDGILDWVERAARKAAKSNVNVFFGGVSSDNVILAGPNGNEVLQATLHMIRETTQRLSLVDKDQFTHFGLLRAGIAWREDMLGGEFQSVRPGLIAYEIGDKHGRPLGSISVTKAVYDRLSPECQREFQETAESSDQGSVFVRRWSTVRDS